MSTQPPEQFPWQEGETFNFRVIEEVRVLGDNGPPHYTFPATGDVVEEIAPNIEVGEWGETTPPERSQPRVEDGRLVKIPEDRLIRFRNRMERRKEIRNGLERRKEIRNGLEALNVWIMDQDWIKRPEAISKVVEAAKDIYEAENVDDHPRYIQGLANLMAAVREISRKNG